jgi:hypothetical protein
VRGIAMHDFPYYLNEFLDLLRQGFEHVNAILGLLIALFAAYQLSEWKRLWAAALGAVIIHIIAVVLIPVIDHSAPFRLPPLMRTGFWTDTLALYLGYLVVIAVFFFIKKNVLRGGGGGHR